MAGLRGMVNYVQEQWGNSAAINVIIVTDGGIGHGQKSLKTLIDYPHKVLMDREVLFPLNFNGTLNVICVNHCEDIQESICLYEKMIEKSGLQGQVIVPKSEPGSILARSSVEKCFQTIVNHCYKPFIGQLSLGDDLCSQITLCPPPAKFRQVKDFEVVEAEIDDKLDVKGFLTLADVASPSVVSRHLILPFSGITFCEFFGVQNGQLFTRKSRFKNYF